MRVHERSSARCCGRIAAAVSTASVAPLPVAQPTEDRTASSSLHYQSMCNVTACHLVSLCALLSCAHTTTHERGISGKLVLSTAACLNATTQMTACVRRLCGGFNVTACARRAVNPSKVTLQGAHLVPIKPRPTACILRPPQCTVGFLPGPCTPHDRLVAKKTELGL